MARHFPSKVLAQGTARGVERTAMTALVLATAAYGPCAHRDPVGVSACDAYVDRYEQCLKTLSDPERERRGPEADAMRKVLRDEAARADARAELESTCRAALDDLRECR
jgi:hypothetical protein